ncbi:transcriptional regulator, y4mF family protein [Bacteroides fragilis str. S24L15]|uniref:XRE family transcriptional regulator n=1 Tax=Bacteroides fragilis TaxID=817 RepID=A0A853PZ08_BACFG|nr:transcriptional regulator, y4mF family protein [Bacteroides fragilis str. 3774 T13]EXZ90635.1 transcriptional regulator, y4mF family protein [Bacteroides fragilis str. J38-1]EXZ95863.1 transcriptional regulator, y4mF family protein [Bacteroides fragilis str. Korea 419]EYA40729.1 transcriptional regulator, y4mF family protein [Bacteroides fragilis str. 20793-3]EYA67952.1 transcriptional regulator, y4mF family protein [Bacteroides fragilis str. S23L24]EYA72718.1 transcriptional regulator, y4m
MGISLLIKQILSIFVSNSQYIGNMKQIGIQIRQRRKMLGINQQTLADLAQISINTITKIENGEININFQKLYAILEVLGLELSLKIKNKEGHL